MLNLRVFSSEAEQKDLKERYKDLKCRYNSVVSVKNYCSVYGVFKGGVFLKRPQVAVTNCEIKYANDLADEG